MTGRGLRGRELARSMMFAVVAVDAFVALLLVMAPNNIGPLTSEPPPNIWWLIPAFGIAWHIAGFVWMIRIYRADPEAHRSWWRFDRG